MLKYEINFMSRQELKDRHEKNCNLISQMVGWLYPSILEGENQELRIRLAILHQIRPENNVTYQDYQI